MGILVSRPKTNRSLQSNSVDVSPVEVSSSSRDTHTTGNHLDSKMPRKSIGKWIRRLSQSSPKPSMDNTVTMNTKNGGDIDKENDQETTTEGSIENGIDLTEPDYITDVQRELIIKSWSVIKSDIASVGVLTFLKLFQTHPDVQDAFLHFKGMTKEEMEYSGILRAHSLRVVQMVDKAVTRIRNPQKIQAIMSELGTRHIKYNAKAGIVDLMGDQFIAAISNSLTDMWTPDMQVAWKHFFSYMTYFMKVAFSSPGQVNTKSAQASS